MYLYCKYVKFLINHFFYAFTIDNFFILSIKQLKIKKDGFFCILAILFWCLKSKSALPRRLFGYFYRLCCIGGVKRPNLFGKGGRYNGAAYH